MEPPETSPAQPQEIWSIAPDLTPAEAKVSERIMKLAEKISGDLMVKAFLHRRIQSLKQRPHPVWLYAGLTDPSRERPAELSEEDAEAYAKEILASLAALATDAGITQLSLENPRIEVCRIAADFPPASVARDFMKNY